MKKNSLSAAVAPKATGNAFAGMSDVLGAGFGDIINSSDYEVAVLKLKDIYVEAQIREELEDEENSMAEMEASVMEHGVFQSVLVRPMENGPAPYKLVAGERRYIASERAGKTDIPALIKVMTDEEAATIQMQENVQRKNLTQIELAKRVQKDLDELGSTEAVLAKHKKGRAWLSQILSLLKLPEQAKRLVSEKISADLDVINSVKVIEKVNPAAAKELVDDLKKSKGKEDSRKKVNEVKAKVKPKAEKGDKATPVEPVDTTMDIFAAAKTDVEQPMPPTAVAAEQTDRPGPALAPWDILTNAYGLIYESDTNPKVFMEALAPEDRANVKDWLQSVFNAGRACKALSQAIMNGLRDHTFAEEGPAAFAMIAFLQGADIEVEVFNAVDILGQVKK